MSWFLVLVLWVFASVVTIGLHRRLSQVTRLRTIGQRATGIVIGHKPDLSGATTIYTALIMFSTQQGHKQETEARVGLSIPTPTKGTEVSIIYDPSNPADCFIETSFEQSGGYVLVIIFWLVAIVSLVFVIAW
ncbi:DUF3592 domain-containing protein [Hymenobacter sp. H14-R3]|uniref:DUF3592 domain-containing protein n=1 Tax=Hymenobacter sp. H14-R3 TaxID=3046308 RepID=UPI0024B886AD|nr:DUF3592 domain-containing protein [Hymenobacter sp. H14-R3]MDJ0365832.1 DUF3592 domain-containing protein [Hymenobacter sp. H14-R3]